jgi:hypothetical protein
MVYAINYDLRKPGGDYSGLYDAIRSCGAWWHYLGSTWLVDTNLDADGVFARLRPHIHADDYLLIHRVVADKQGWLPQEAWNWINERRHSFA